MGRPLTPKILIKCGRRVFTGSVIKTTTEQFDVEMPDGSIVGFELKTNKPVDDQDFKVYDLCGWNKVTCQD